MKMESGYQMMNHLPHISVTTISLKLRIWISGLRSTNYVQFGTF